MFEAGSFGGPRCWDGVQQLLGLIATVLQHISITWRRATLDAEVDGHGSLTLFRSADEWRRLLHGSCCCRMASLSQKFTMRTGVFLLLLAVFTCGLAQVDHDDAPEELQVETLVSITMQ